MLKAFTWVFVLCCFCDCYLFGQQTDNSDLVNNDHQTESIFQLEDRGVRVTVLSVTRGKVLVKTTKKESKQPFVYTNFVSVTFVLEFLPTVLPVKSHASGPVGFVDKTGNSALVKEQPDTVREIFAASSYLNEKEIPSGLVVNKEHAIWSKWTMRGVKLNTKSPTLFIDQKVNGEYRTFRFPNVFAHEDD